MTVVATAEPLVADAVDYTDGSMVCLYIDPTTAAGMAVEGGQPPDQLHITLAFLPEGVEFPETVAARLFDLGQWHEPLAGQIGGLGMFAPGDEGVPVIALPDVPGLADLRVAVATMLAEEGVTVADNHGFLPHITLAYGDTTIDPGILGTPIQFAEVSLVVGPERWDLPLGGAVAAAGWREVREPVPLAPLPRSTFDPDAHPRHPAGVRDRIRSPSDGGKFRAKVGVTPFRPEDDPIDFYQSPKFKQFEAALAETADRYDVTIDAKDRVQGYREGEQEPSLALDVHDGEEGVRMFAEDLRGQWDQDAVLLFSARREGDAIAYRTEWSSLTMRARGKAVIGQALADAGIQGATIYKEGFEVIGDENDWERVATVTDSLGIPRSAIKVRAGDLSFASRPDEPVR